MSQPLQVKICGITRLEDALAAVRLGADALGFNFWEGSKRFCPPQVARDIIRQLPPFVSTVGVFVNPSARAMARTVSLSGIAVVQLHGNESVSFCRSVTFPLIKAIQVQGPQALLRLERFAAAAILLDAPSTGFGGSGLTFDWKLARPAAKRHRLILAGGLHPTNVGAAIRSVRPYGIDVASGVESAPGIKDHRKLARFLRAARSA